MKSPKVKSDLQIRAALRAGQERRLKHAVMTINSLIAQHAVNEREMEHDLATLGLMHSRLLTAIRNQHVKDRTVATARIEAGSY